MIDRLINLQIGGFYGGDLGRLLVQWQQAGVFAYALPFLIIFALTYGILTKTRVFDNKAINSILSLSVALLSLQFHFVPMFFSEIFPRMGVGLAVILVLIILMGLFFDVGQSSWFRYLMFATGAIIFLVVVFQTFGWLGWGGFWWNWRFNWPQIIAVAIFVGLIIWLLVGGDNGKKKGSSKDYEPMILQVPRSKG